MCIADPSESWPASQGSVVRRPGEACHPFWQRALVVIREMKSERGQFHPITVCCMTAPPPVNPGAADYQACVEMLLLHLAEHASSSEVRAPPSAT